MFAVDAEHEHCPVLQGREEMLSAFGKDHFKEIQFLLKMLQQQIFTLDL